MERERGTKGKFASIPVLLFRYCREDPIKGRHVKFDDPILLCCGCKVLNLKTKETNQENTNENSQ